MTEVQVIDLFSGCGGMSCGFMLADTRNIRYKLLGGLDVDPHANATYERMLSRPALNMSAMDFLNEKPGVLESALAAWGYSDDLPLVLIGCAPCQGFSSHRKKDPREDERNKLIAAFARIALRLQPEVVLMENVPELLHSKHWSHFTEFKRHLERDGYKVRAQIHNAAEYGVPQERFRALVIAARSDHLLHMPSPTHKPGGYVTVRDAIGSLPPLAAGERDAMDSMHITSKHRPDTVRLLKAIPPNGGSRSALPKHMVRDCHKTVDGFRDVYGRLWWDRPAVSITARCRTPSCGRFTHPVQHRGLTVREAALLQSFPSNWNFEGPFDDKYKQIGNAVAPNFARAIAMTIDTSWTANCAPSQRDRELDVRRAITRSISSSIGAWKRRSRIDEVDEEVIA
jgi:DNA (cytosine-5)-methyltransferase 1